MSITNLSEPNNYSLYINKHASKDLTLKAVLPSNITVGNDIILNYGSGEDNIPPYAFVIYKGNFSVNNTNGQITIPKSGYYLIIIKTNYIATSSAGNVSVRDIKYVTDAEGVIYVKSQKSYVIAEANETMEESISSIVYLDKDLQYIFKSRIIVLEGIGNVTYKGGNIANEDYNSITLHYLD